MSTSETYRPTRRSWLWKLTRFLISIFIYRRGGEPPPRFGRETRSESQERLARPGLGEDVVYRASNRFVIETVLQLWKAVVGRGRRLLPEDDEFVERFIDDSISRQISPEEREIFREYYRGLDAGSLSVRNCCHMLQRRARPELRRQIAEALYRFAYWHGFDRERMDDINFYCQLMKVPSEQIRQADLAARREFGGMGGTPLRTT